jgi:hypothetical protein
MAGVLVWQLRWSPAPEAAPVRELVGRLTGRQVRRGPEPSAPALLAGLGVLLAMMEALETYPLERLRAAAAFIKGLGGGPDTS